MDPASQREPARAKKRPAALRRTQTVGADTLQQQSTLGEPERHVKPKTAVEGRLRPPLRAKGYPVGLVREA